MWLIWVTFIKKDLGLIESIFASVLLFCFIVEGRKSLAACFGFCEVWHAINGVGRNRLVAVLRTRCLAVFYFYIHTHPFFVHPPTGSWGLNLTYKHPFQFWSQVPWAGIFSLVTNTQQARLPGWSARTALHQWVQTQLSSVVLTDGTAGLASRWAAYWAAASDLQGLFFPIASDSVFSIASNSSFSLFYFFFLLFLSPWYPASSDTHTQSIAPPSQVTTACSPSRPFPSFWHLFTWFCACWALSCFSRWIFRA